MLAVPETGGDKMEQREGLSRGWETTFPRSCSTCRCVRDNFPLPAISFEQCERRLGGPAAARTAARRLRDLSWLHFPKVGRCRCAGRIFFPKKPSSAPVTSLHLELRLVFPLILFLPFSLHAVRHVLWTCG